MKKRFSHVEYEEFRLDRYKKEIINSYFVKNNLWNKDYINKIFKERFVKNTLIFF